MARFTAPTRSGFTLLEALMASSLLAAAVMGIAMPFAVGAESQREDARRTLATALAQELMEEILTKNFNDAGMNHEGAETSRALYDCINDYNGYLESEGQITNNCGHRVTDPAATGFSRSANVSYITVSGQSPPPQPNFASVVVEVKYRGQGLVKLTRLAYQP